MRFPRFFAPLPIQVWNVLCLALLSLCGQLAADTPAERFDKTIAPILAANCLSCHNATESKGKLDLSRAKTAKTGGESGAAIVPGQLDKSYLWERINQNEMPPKDRLSEEDKARLKQWILDGAVWGTDPIDPLRFTTTKRAGYDWWSLQSLTDPRPPWDPASSDFVRNSIDAFVWARQREQNLSPSPEAGRRELIRRLSYDLRGLPPEPSEVELFVGDPRLDAYEQLVDRYLASPQFGERWARHWLDLARFGESQGFERDKLRSNSWRYRDWVMDALNEDMPYHEFARRQIAGDVLDPEDPNATIATGFLVAGPYDEVGQSQQSAAMKAVVRQDEMEDIVSVVGQTFLGLTVHCARCHDHKFDPITQKEYYQFVSALSGVRHGQPGVVKGELALRSQMDIEGLAARIAGLESKKLQLEAAARGAILAARKDNPNQQAVAPKPLAAWEFDGDFKDRLGKLHGKPHGNARVKDGWLLLDGQSYVATEILNEELAEKTLEAWVTVYGLGQRGGGVLSVQTPDGGVFDAIVFGERDPRQWMAGSNNFSRTQSFSGETETREQPNPVHIAITYAKDGTIRGYRNGQPYGKPYQSSKPAVFPASKSQVLFGLRHSPAGGNRYFTGSIDKARIYSRALTPAEVAVSAGVPYDSITESELLARLSPKEQRARAALQFEIEELKSQQRRHRETQAYAVSPQEPPPTHRLARGETTQPKELVSPAGIVSLKSVDADFALSPEAPEAERRKKLADWITHRDNSLFARTIVNRLWHYHFGRGLVETPSDLGFNGSRPTHPELLDWLAGELIRSGGSLKHIHRLILCSATYRQSSQYDAAKHGIDGDNRFLWRKSPARLEAEAVRDAMLAVSGQLNLRMHGPGFQDFTTYVANSQFYEMLDPDGFAFQRRSLYRTWVRSGRSGFLDVFDCPDPSAKAPKRAVTTTPLQALSLMNHSFAMRMADRFAKRLQSEAGNEAQAQVERAYDLALGRGPQREEVDAGSRFIRQHGLEAFCRVLLNCNEFLYVD